MVSFLEKSSDKGSPESLFQESKQSNRTDMDLYQHVAGKFNLNLYNIGVEN
jgi:hypothetical protein